MICKKCGENLPNNARECFTCGAKVVREEVKPAVTETTEGTPPAPKKGISVGKLFKYMYTSSTYFVMCLLVSITCLCSVVSFIEAVSLGDVSTYVSEIISLGLEIALCVFMWKMYFQSKTTVAGDYIGRLKFFKIFMLVRMLSAIPTIIIFVIIYGIIGVASGDFMTALTTAVITVFIFVLPSYLAYQFAISLERSAVSDLVLFRGLSSLKTVQLVFCVFFAICAPIYIFFALDAILRFESFSAITNVLSTVVGAMTYFYVYEWLKDIEKKLEQN